MSNELPRFWIGDLRIGDAKADGAASGQFFITMTAYNEKRGLPAPTTPANPFTGRAGRAWTAFFNHYAGFSEDEEWAPHLW